MGLVTDAVVASASIRENYLQLVNNILVDCGENKVTTLISPTTKTEAIMSMLNLTVEEIWTRAWWWFGQSTWTIGPEAGVTYRDLPSNFVKFASDPRDPTRRLEYVDPQDLDRVYPIQDTTDVDGTPLYYTLWADGQTTQRIHFYPPPDSDYCDSKVVSQGGSYYVCKVDHTAAAANKPGSGADWEDYWVEDSGITSATAWASGTDYKAGRIILRYYRKPTPMLADGHVADIPDAFFDLLKTGARARYKQWRQDQDWGGEMRLFYEKLTVAIRTKTQGPFPRMVRLWR